MSQTLPRVQIVGDAELISAVRSGDVDAYGDLFERHVDAARRLARQLVSAGDVDDLVSDAFTKVLGVLQRGGGPDVAFRAYLLTAVRRLHIDKIRSNSKVTTTDDMEPFDPGVPFRDTAVENFENAAAAKAFSSLPERWQLVLWHIEVEGNRPADIAPLLGMSANSVSALAYRAREGLRQAFLNMHVQELDTDTCRWTHEHIGAYVRNAVSKRDAAKIEQHLDECRKCMAIYLELTDINSNLAAILSPMLLGAAGIGYISTTGGVAKGGLLAFLSAHSTATVSGGIAVAAVVAASTYLLLDDNGPDPEVPQPPAIMPRPAAATPRMPVPSPKRKTPVEAASIPALPLPTPIPAAPTPAAPSPIAPPPQAAPTSPAPPPVNPNPTAAPTPAEATPSPSAQTPTAPPIDVQPPANFSVAMADVSPPKAYWHELNVKVDGLPTGSTSSLRVELTTAPQQMPLYSTDIDGCRAEGTGALVCPISENGQVGTFRFAARQVSTWEAQAAVDSTGITDKDSSNNTAMLNGTGARPAGN